MELVWPLPMFFDPQTQPGKKHEVKSQARRKPKLEKRLFCAACHSPITHQDERIAVQGGHEHRCTNPHGISYRLGCFSDARGCTIFGEETTKYTWFKGYAWRIALCAHCREHLGWQFDSVDQSFYGLILDRLISTPASQTGG